MPGPYVLLPDPLSNLVQPFTSPQPANNFVGITQEYLDQPPSHGEVIVFKGIPAWLGLEIRQSSCVDDNLVLVNLGIESSAVFVSHFLGQSIEQELSPVLNSVDEFLVMGRVTDALEKFDSFFSF